MISLGWVLFDLPRGDLPFVVILTLEQQREAFRAVAAAREGGEGNLKPLFFVRTGQHV